MMRYGGGLTRYPTQARPTERPAAAGTNAGWDPWAGDTKRRRGTLQKASLSISSR